METVSEPGKFDYSKIKTERERLSPWWKKTLLGGVAIVIVWFSTRGMAEDLGQNATLIGVFVLYAAVAYVLIWFGDFAGMLDTAERRQQAAEEGLAAERANVAFLRKRLAEYLPEYLDDDYDARV